MKVLFVLPYALDIAPGQRYRIEQWLPYLRANGVECDVLPLMTPEEQHFLHSRSSPAGKARVVGTAFSRALRHLSRRERYDAVWLYRTVLLAGPAIVERLIKATGAPIVYDFDDAIWLADTTEANRLWAFLKWPKKTGQICRMANAVITGNEILADYARGFNSNVWVVPSTVELEKYTPREHGPHEGPVIIGWSGSPTTVEHLATVSRALQQVAAQASVELRVMGGEFELPGVNVGLRRWSPEREVPELREFDIGIMPLPDEPWTRGKCAMKALLYMAVGVPTVASPVGVNSEIIRHGENGLLAATEGEWVEQLLRLVQDPALRERLGRAGRRTVEAGFSAQVQAPRVLSILESVASRRSGRRSSTSSTGAARA